MAFVLVLSLSPWAYVGIELFLAIRVSILSDIPRFLISVSFISVCSFASDLAFFLDCTSIAEVRCLPARFLFPFSAICSLPRSIATRLEVLMGDIYYEQN